MTTKAQTFEPIPQPATQGAMGNAAELVPHRMAESFARLAQIYGPLFKLEMPGRQMVVATNYAFANELCDEQRFIKKTSYGLRAVRRLVPNSIFTVSTEDPVWEKAHNVVLPLFSPQAIQSYSQTMWQVALQMILRWENMNPDDEIDVVNNMVRFTTDVIGLSGLSYHFNSFYRETPHPLMQSLMRSVETALFGSPESHEQMLRDAEYTRQVVEDLIHQRMIEGLGKHDDMLDRLLSSFDKKTGEKLDGPEAVDQLLTLLFAGHLTTSSLLSFTLYQLISHPGVLAKAYDEVDQVFDTPVTQPPTQAQLNQLTYLSRILKETLRMYPPAPQFAVHTRGETQTLGQRYQVNSQQDLIISSALVHRDKTVWGEDANIFNPDRFLPELEAQIPINAYKPFGNGVRACIGRQFALQEATLVISMLLRHFDFIDHMGYQLDVQESPNPKPINFKLQVKRRAHVQPLLTQAAETLTPTQPTQAPTATTAAGQPTKSVIKGKTPNIPVYVLFGSNLGTSEAVARQIGDDARSHGFVTQVAPLDQAVNNIHRRPGDCAVVIVASSYNGNPPDNATQFYNWLQDPALPTDSLKGVRYAVFGCGNKQWAASYQAVPTFIDKALSDHGAERIQELGQGDTNADFAGMFSTWYQQLWPSMANAFSFELDQEQEAKIAGPLYSLEIAQGELTPSPYIASYGAVPLQIHANYELQNQKVAEPRSTRCIEIELPAGTQYRAGDHIGILAFNSPEAVERVAQRFGCDNMTTMRIHKNDTRHTTLPVGKYIRVHDVLMAFLELHEVATRKQIEKLVEYTKSPAEKEHLMALVADTEKSQQLYQQEILQKHVTLIDLLETHPSCDLPLALYLELLSPIKPRYYSISSSSLVTPEQGRITVGVLEEEALSGNGIHKGMCSNFLSRRKPGDTIYGFVQQIKSPFHHPEDVSIPIIMIGAGTGLAPFMGFLQERSVLKQQGTQVGPSLLFFGCRHPDQDFLYKDELQAYEQQQITQVYPAFSRQDPNKKVYVQDKILEQQDLVWDFIMSGAPTFICGDLEHMVPAVAQAYRAIYQNKQGASPEEAERWLQEMTKNARYVVDIWGTGSVR